VNSQQQIIKNSKAFYLDDGQHKMICPFCNDKRKNKGDKSLSVKIDGQQIVYNCHNCMESGAMNKNQNERTSINSKGNVGIGTKIKKPAASTNIYQSIVIPDPQRGGEADEYLKVRGIDVDKSIDWGCLPTVIKGNPAVAFVYEDKAIKYRSVPQKRFWFEGENQFKLWGNTVKNEDVPHLEDTIIITEGELDCLAVKTAFANAVDKNKRFTVDCFSVPNGANAKVKNGEIDPKEDGRFKYVWNDKEKFEGKEKIVLAVDNDESGQALQEELSRRLGIANCYTINYQKEKDANDMLMMHGADALCDAVLNAKPMPLKYLRTVEDYQAEMDNLYDNGNPKGVSTGFTTLDNLFTLKRSALVVVTGMPNTGKSNFVSQLVFNVAKNYGWKTCFCSFEMPPALHTAQLSQMYVGKPFFEGYTERMTVEEKDNSAQFIKDHFLFMDFKEGANIDSILESASQSIQRMGCRILVIDPFNYITRPNKGLVTDEVSDMLTKINVFAKEKNVLVFFVCHPAKPMDRSKKFVPTGMDISHSMSFFAKADLGFSVHRGEEAVEIHCWKSRYYWLGRQGMCKMDYNPVTGTYTDHDKKDDYDWTL